jgi:hypothetical protein
MAVAGIPSQNQIPPFALDALQAKSKNLVLYGLGGVKYSQYGPTTAIANTTTATSILNQSSTTSIGSILFSSTELVQGQALTITGGGPGCLFRFKAVGTIGNTGTPNITIDFGFKNAAGTYTAIATSGAVAMTTITGTGQLEIVCDGVVKSYNSSTGVIGMSGYLRYNSTIVPVNFTLSSSMDTTANLTFESQITWGTASASNTATISQAYIEVLN